LVPLLARALWKALPTSLLPFLGIISLFPLHFSEVSRRSFGLPNGGRQPQHEVGTGSMGHVMSLVVAVVVVVVAKVVAAHGGAGSRGAGQPTAHPGPGPLVAVAQDSSQWA
jgi:hypothetical protein